MQRAVLDLIARGLTARDLAVFPVECGTMDAVVGDLLDRMSVDRDDFSHMPLRDSDQRVVAVLHRDRPAVLRDCPAREVAVPLDEARHVVDADEPLNSVITKLAHANFLLVRSPESDMPDRIAGIINHADLGALPIRLFIYTRVIQFEHRVLDHIAGIPWGSDPRLQGIWKRISGAYARSDQARRRPESYLHFPDVVQIGRVRGLFALSPEEEETLARARNFAAHAVIDAPDEDAMEPEKMIGAVRKAVSLLERLVPLKHG